MISKELLSEVLNIKIEDIIDLKMFGKDLKYYEKCLLKSCCDGRLSNHKDSICKSINIYELSYKCKEWAFTQEDFILESAFVSKGKFTSCYCVAEKNFSYPTLKETFHDNMEQQSIFKACQWILDNKKEGN